MKAILPLLILFTVPLWAVEPVNPEKPKLFRGQSKVVDKKVNSLKTVTVPIAPGLYRTWLNPVKQVTKPSENARFMTVLTPTVRKPALEQTFFKSKEWKPGKVVQLYEKSKDFDTLLNPLALRDFNRFIYQRNPSSP
jgi:hypothetical protein